MRDHVMGVRAVTGRAEIIRSGGRVLKNVTGLDLCKLLTGSHGTLGVISEVTLKVLPAPEATGTLVLPGLDAAAAVTALSAALGSPFTVSGAAWLPAEATARVPNLSGVAFGHADPYRGFFGIRQLPHRPAEGPVRGGGAITLDTGLSRAVWKDVRDALPLAAHTDDAVWRISVRPSAGPSVLQTLQARGVAGFLDWGGGLVWLAGPADTTTHAAVEAAAQAAGGTWTLLRAPRHCAAPSAWCRTKPPRWRALPAR